MIILNIINKILENNQGSANLLKKYNGKTFKIKFMNLGFKALINEEGFLNPNFKNESTVEIIIAPDILNFLMNQDKIEALKKINLNGDKAFGFELIEILANLHLTGIYDNNIPGANLVLNLFKVFAKYVILINKNFAISISEYLLYNKGTIVTKNEIALFCEDVENLKKRFDLCAQKLIILSK